MRNLVRSLPCVIAAAFALALNAQTNDNASLEQPATLTGVTVPTGPLVGQAIQPEDLSADISKLQALAAQGQALSDAAAAMTAPTEFQGAMARMTNEAAIGSPDVTNAACMADVAYTFLTGLETNVSSAARLNLARAVTAESIAKAMQSLRTASNALVEARFETRLAVAGVQVKRAEKLQFGHGSVQMEIAGSFEYREWFKKLETEWNHNNILSRQFREYSEFLTDTGKVFNDLSPVVPPDQLSAAVAKSFSSRFPNWVK